MSEHELKVWPEFWSVLESGEKGVKGELYPCKPDIFSATYEAVT